ncbi:hypothetical protein Syun_017235 [Stephania yunnanensis]|uniref:Uncharacterized protein n=1 Tax=Stephania yunnanensis TaxID=152371 RepID=A0AAP0P2W1_9MAGN
MSLEQEMRDPRYYINLLLFGNAIACLHVFRLTFARVQSREEWTGKNAITYLTSSSCF